MSRRYNLRRIKSHLTYTAPELARTCNVTITAVRRWTKEGLRPIDGTRPYLFAPSDIVAFLGRKNKVRQPLLPGTIYCVACKGPRYPLEDIADLRPVTVTSGELVGTCPVCGHRIFRRVRLTELHDKTGTLKVRYEDVQVPIGNGPDAPRTALAEETMP